MSYFEQNNVMQQGFTESPENGENYEQAQQLEDGDESLKSADAVDMEGGERNDVPQTPQEGQPQSPKRSRRKKQDAGDIFNEYAEPEPELDAGNGDSENDFIESKSNEAPDVAALEGPVRLRRVRRQSERPVLLDAEGRVIRDRMDSAQQDIAILTAAQNRREILSATLESIEADGSIVPRVSFHVGAVKVVIPFTEMGLDLDANDLIDARLKIGNMMGAKIYYVVLGVDAKNRIAGASRRRAMMMRRRLILNARSSNGNFRIRKGTHCTAQVLHVGNHHVRLEIYGMETYIYIGDISNLWVTDIREVISVGEERSVEIVEVERDPQTGEATLIKASLKLAEEKPQAEIAAKQTLMGTVTGFSGSAYFVRAAGIPQEIRCPMKSNYIAELLEKGDYVKFFIRGVHMGVPTGGILKILKKARHSGR